MPVRISTGKDAEMHICDEDAAKTMAKSLLNHAREIHRYALAYCRPSESNRYLGSKRRAAFAAHLERMLKEMYALMLMARYKGVSRFCNREQIEAYMDAAAAIVYPKSPVVSDSRAILN